MPRGKGKFGKGGGRRGRGRHVSSVEEVMRRNNRNDDDDESGSGSEEGSGSESGSGSERESKKKEKKDKDADAKGGEDEGSDDSDDSDDELLQAGRQNRIPIEKRGVHMSKRIREQMRKEANKRRGEDPKVIEADKEKIRKMREEAAKKDDAAAHT